MAHSARTTATESPAKQVERFIAKFDPAIAKLVRSVRSVLRKRFPTAIELVYDNYNALAIGYSSNREVDLRASTAPAVNLIVSLAAVRFRRA